MRKLWRGIVFMATAMALLMSFRVTEAADKKVSVYVLCSSNYCSSNYYEAEWIYFYRKDGLLKEIKSSWGNDKCSYDNKKRLKKISYSVGESDLYYDKNGRLLKVTSGGKIDKMFCYDKKNRISKVNEIVCQYNKSGWLIKDGLTTYKYDKKHNITLMLSGGWKPFSYKNKYDKHKLLNERYSGGVILKYRYKKIKVDKKLVSQVRKQQWSLLNHDVNYVFSRALGMGLVFD